ncbi:MAG: guanylate kinase [Lachnospiraceae bacterium]|nr:guanylate kinase [Lachnospiraceae bacterium]
MGKIFYIMGKSASGKDTIYQKLMEEKEFDFHTVVPYTTRPMRTHEINGRDYFFTDEAGLEEIRQQGRLIELRSYSTVHGIWNYFTVDDGQLDLANYNYLLVGTLESYAAMRRYYGAEVMMPILVEVEDGVRLQRALDREKSQDHPKYAEMCRRFLADAEDFSEEKIEAAGIVQRFGNDSFEDCLKSIRNYIREKM